jgi:hypothetical protein
MNNQTVLVFSNSNYINNKKVSNNKVKSNIISNLKKAEKVLADNKYKKLQTDLILNLKNNNTIIVNIKNNNYKYDIYNSSGGNSSFTNTNTNTNINESDEYIPTTIGGSSLSDESDIQEEQTIPVSTVELSEPSSTQESSEPVSTQESSEPVSTQESSEPVSMQESSQQVSTQESLEQSSTQESLEQSSTQKSSEPVSTPESSHPVSTQSIPIQESSELSSTQLSTQPVSTQSMPIQQSTELSSIQDNKKNVSKGFWESIFSGGDKNEDSDNEQTYLVDSDDSDEESFIDNAKLKNKKYLNSLNVQKLKTIMKDNHMQIFKNGSYIKKNEMIKSIQKKFK